MKKTFTHMAITAFFAALMMAPAASTAYASGDHNPCGAGHAEKHNPCDAKMHNPCDAKMHNPCDAKKHNPCDAKKHNPCHVKMHNPGHKM